MRAGCKLLKTEGGGLVIHIKRIGRI